MRCAAADDAPRRRPRPRSPPPASSPSYARSVARRAVLEAVDADGGHRWSLSLVKADRKIELLGHRPEPLVAGVVQRAILIRVGPEKATGPASFSVKIANVARVTIPLEAPGGTGKGCSAEARSGGGDPMTTTGIAVGQLSEAEHGRQLRRAVVASTVGTVIEAYDFLLYVIVAPLVFAKLFFPAYDPLT